MTKLPGILYRIMTEEVNRAEIIKLADKYFDGYSTSRPDTREGHWNGQEEKSLLIEVITDKKSDVMKLANDIKIMNKQEAVLVEAIPNTAWLI